jgi:protein TonB
MNSHQLLATDYLDILYYRRNKSYGSYELRKHYDNRATKALLLMLSLMILGIGTPYVWKKLNPNLQPAGISITHEIPITLSPIDIPSIYTPPPPVLPEQSAAPTAKAKTIQNITPTIIDNELRTPQQAPPENDAMKDAVAGPVTYDGDTGGTDIATSTVPHTGPFGTGSDVNSVLASGPSLNNTVSTEPIVPDEIAEYPGGIQALMNHLANNIKYPYQAMENGIQGKVILKFIVNTDGSITDIVVFRGIGAGCEQEAIRVVSSMKKWKPGKKNGKAVRSYYTLPVSFKLQ